MKTIWKFPLTTDMTSVSVPIGSKFLTIQMQNSAVCVWYLVDPEAEMEVRKFQVYGTGHELPSIPGEYVGTVQLLGGSLVLHVFEEKE